MPYDIYPRLTNREISLESSDVVDNISSLSYIPVTLSVAVTNLTGETCSFDQAMGLYRDGQLQTVVSELSSIGDMAVNSVKKQSVSLELESTLSNGVYTLVPLSKAAGSEKWRKNGNYDQFATVVIYADRAKLYIGPPDKELDIITFACVVAKSLCVRNWDTNGDGELSKEEAAAVTSLNNVFEGDWSITSFDELQFFTGLTAIGKREFLNCVKLTSVVIPENVRTIGDQSFHTYALKQISIPAKVTSIGNDVFTSQMETISVDERNPAYDSRGGCNALIETATNTLIVGCRNTVIPEGVVVIAPSAFNGCEGLTSIKIPSTVTSIGESAFCRCSSLTSINIPEGVTIIGDYAFSGCTGLPSINIPEKVTSIGKSSFSGCKGLTTVFIPSSVTNIGGSAFSGCTGLTEITIPNGVKTIGGGAFGYCTGLTSVTVPNSVDSIGVNPFQGCKNLLSITVDAGNAHYKSVNNNSAMIETASSTLVTGCANTVIPEGIVAIGESAFSGCTGLTSIIIPSSVTSIGDHAFWGCSGLTSVTIPSVVTSLGKNIFRDCKNLREVTILDGITIIEDFAFSGCTGLTSISIPSTVKSIGYSAFSGCTGLTSFTIPSSITTIGNDAFSGCTGLTSITIPSGVTSIGNMTFYNCSGLTSISIPETVTNIGEYAFYNCTGLNSITIPNGVTTIGDVAFCKCSGLSSIVIPESVTEIGIAAFRDCVNLEAITFPGNILEIGKLVLYNCPKLTLIEVKKPIPISIDNRVFSVDAYNNATLCVPEGSKAAYETAENWKRFTNIVENSIIYFEDAEVKRICVENWDLNGDGELSVAEAENVTSLGGVFANNESIGTFRELVYFTGLKSIGENEFSNTCLLYAIRIPDGVTSIGNYAFQGSAIDVISFPNSLTTIGNGAFRYSSIRSINIPKNVSHIEDDAFYETNPKSISVKADNKWYDSRNDCNALIETSTNTLIKGCKNTVISEDIRIINSHAFDGANGLSVTIPKSVVGIQSYAFGYDLSSVKVKWVKPIEIPSSAFPSYNEDIKGTLYVPRGTKASYEAAEEWKRFSSIVEYGNYVGDVNGDGKVNVTDVTQTISHILGNTPENFDGSVADLNDDGAINTSDITLMLKAILGTAN